MMRGAERDGFAWPAPPRDWENHYFYGLWKGKEYARLHLQFTDDICYIHLYIKMWNTGVLREMRRDFNSLRVFAAEHGAARLVGAVGYTGAELDRWQRMLHTVGFPRAEPVMISDKEAMMTVLEI